jgi:hypothetical protein
MIFVYVLPNLWSFEMLHDGHPANKRMEVQLSKALDLTFERVFTLINFVLLFQLKASPQQIW